MTQINDIENEKSKLIKEYDKKLKEVQEELDKVKSF
jgi:hypothetical protein